MLFRFRFFIAAPLALGWGMLFSWVSARAAAPAESAPEVRVLQGDWLELTWRQTRDRAGSQPWSLVLPSEELVTPAPGAFAVNVAGQRIAVKRVGLKRRVESAPLAKRDLRVATWVYLQLERAVPEGAELSVTNPDGTLWPASAAVRTSADRLRESPAIHINQEGYLPEAPKQAMVGYYLGTAGELAIAANNGFQLVTPTGSVVYRAALTRRPERGYDYSPKPYQEVYEADFSAFRTPGSYRLVVPGLGASAPFRIDAGLAMDFARTYALGLYHQRCGAENVLPFTRFVHAPCHTAPASVPTPQGEFAFTWKTIAQVAADESREPGQRALPLASEGSQLFPFVRRGEIDVAGGHHDAGDYSKYTINSAAFIHTLIFAVDALPGVAALDNLGLPESGDGLSDVLQEAKWEVEFLAKMQDSDGGFYFLVYPRDRAYESNVLPDQGDRQVVWPKNSAATAAAVAALAQASSSPRFRQAYPALAQTCRERAERGWRFLEDAIEAHGREGIYQRLTHYGDNHLDRDELAWAACELFLATGEPAYQERFRDWCDPTSDNTRRWGWWRLNESWGNAIRSYAFAARTGRLRKDELDQRLLEACEQEIETTARDQLRWSDHTAYGTSMPDETKHVRGGGWYFSLDQAFDLAVASQLDYPSGNDPRPAFLEAFLANLNYEAGTNPLNLSYITGLGARRQREIVHQYAQNDRRVLPPSGLPLGNIQAGQPYLALYEQELAALSWPADGADEAPYPYYDRWSDTFNVSTEFVIVNQARALGGLAWLAGRTNLAYQAWRPSAGTITGLPEKAAVGGATTVRLAAPAGLDPAQAEIIWEARNQEPTRGTSFTFTPGANGRQWVEAEAKWPDGRRVFAVANFNADNGRPVVTVTTTTTEVELASGRPGVFVFRRTGDLSAPLTVHYDLRGDATKWNDYRRPEGDMPVEIVIPAGQETAELMIAPVAEGLGPHARHVLLEIKPDDAYNRSAPQAAVLTLIGEGATVATPRPELPALGDE